MLQALLTRLPPDAGGRGVVLALTAAGAGLFLWVIGARVSRSVFTLVGVAAGAWVGLHLPRSMGWEIDAMAVAIGGALVVGLAGYLLHMLWVGLTLGTLLASAGVFIAWHRLAAGASWSMPVIEPPAPALDLLRDNWQKLPNGLSRVIPIVAGMCFATGALTATLLPKLARVLTFSLLGSLLLACGAIAATAMARPEWLVRIPASTQTQGVILATVVMFGAVIQWALLPRVSKPAAPKLSTQSKSEQPPRPARLSREIRDIRDLGSTPLGPLKPKEVRA